MDHQRERRPEQERNRLEVLERVERHVLDQRRIGGERACRGQQRVAVRRRVGNGGGSNVAAGADAVLDDDRLAELLLKFGSHCAHHDVDATAGRESDDEGDRSARELLSEATATERKGACQRERNQNGTTCDHRSFPSGARKSIRTIPGRIRRCATWTRPPPSPSSRPIPSGQGRARTIWPQPRQFDYPGTALAGGRSIQMGFSAGTWVARGVASSAP